MARAFRPSQIAAVVAVAAAACADQAPTAPPGAPAADVGVADASGGAGGQYVVGMADGRTPDSAAVAAAGGRIVGTVPQLGLYFVADVADPAPLVGSDGARFVERDFSVHLDAQQLEPAPDLGASANDAPAPAVTSAAAGWLASGLQWDLKAMRADETIAAAARGAGVNVCIIDSGIDGTHQELSGKVDRAASFVPNSAAQLDSNGHGTHVSGSVAGRGLVMSGVAPDARLFAAKAFDESGSASSIRPMLEGIVWCTDNGAHVINMSLGGTRFLAGRPATSEPDVQAYTTAMNYAAAAGVVVVTSAGNSNLRLPNPARVIVPAQVPGTIIVGATGPVSRAVPAIGSTGAILTLRRDDPPNWNPFDPAQVVAGPDARAYYSNFGAGVDVFAPGGRQAHSTSFALRITTETVVDSATRLPVSPARTARVQHGSPYDAIWSACSQYSTYSGAPDAGGRPGTTRSCRAAGETTRYAALQGTSMAAPHVAGLAAVLYEAAGGARSPEARAKVERCIRSTTDDVGPRAVYGGGRVNAVRALACARS
jgi:subtilisin family serine protease